MSDRPPIVVPVDFSECSVRALRRALEVAKALDRKILLLHVVDTSGLVVGGLESYIDVAAVATQIRADAEAELAKLRADVDPDRRLISQVEIFDGRPVQAIVDCAKAHNADLIAIGTHGRTGLPRLFMGSVAERVVRSAPCDVLVVH